MWESVAIVAAAALVWFCFDSMRVREAALEAAMHSCERDGLQFLDGAAACISTRLARDESGRMRLRRTYRFEFSDDSYHRREGTVVMLGGVVESVVQEPFLL